MDVIDICKLGSYTGLELCKGHMLLYPIPDLYKHIVMIEEIFDVCVILLVGIPLIILAICYFIG